MSEQFYEGQGVEIYDQVQDAHAGFKERWRWRKAKIVRRSAEHVSCYLAAFPDNTSGVFDADHIRAINHKVPLPWL